MAQTHASLWINYHENEHESFLVRSAYVKTIILKQNSFFNSMLIISICFIYNVIYMKHRSYLSVMDG